MSFSPNQVLKYIESFFLPPIGLIKHDLRLVGPTLQALNFLTFFEAKHCQGNYYIRTHAFLSTAGNSLWLIISPDPKTILSGLLRPKAYRKIRRFEREAAQLEGIISDSKIAKVLNADGKIRGGFKLLFEDKGTMIGDLIASLYKPIKALTSNQIGHYAFKVIDKNLTIGWYAFLAEVGEDGIINWASSIIKIESAEDCGTATFNGNYIATQAAPFNYLGTVPRYWTVNENMGWSTGDGAVGRSANCKGFAVVTFTGTFSTSGTGNTPETHTLLIQSGGNQGSSSFTISGPSGSFIAEAFVEWDSDTSVTFAVTGGPDTQYYCDTQNYELAVLANSL